MPMTGDVAEWVHASDRREWVRERFGRDPDNYTPEVLQKLADSPIMDPNKIYLPAGQLNPAQYRARVAGLLTADLTE